MRTTASTVTPALSLVLAALALACTSGCGSPARAVAGDPTTAKEALGDKLCSKRALQDEPELMGWDPASRAKLNRMRNDGVVAVRYGRNGCAVELELLPHCRGTGSYRYTPYYAKESIVVSDEGELQAKLPLGAVQLAGKARSGRTLRTDYQLVGTDALPTGKRIGRSALSGSDCPRATHVIGTVYLGGFALAAGTRAELEGGVSLFGLGSDGTSAAKGERLQAEGSPEACEEARRTGKEQKQCAVPLRIGLLSLDGASSNGSGTPAGMSTPSPFPAPAAGPCPPDMARVAGGRLQVMGKMIVLGPYCLDLREVTARQYEKCVRSGKCEAHNVMTSGAGTLAACNYRKEGREEHPINCMDASDAKAYCQAQGKRLPRLEELEWAARGQEQRVFPWGETRAQERSCIGRRKLGTCSVGAFPSGATPEGLLDLSGNVEDLGEWEDAYVGFGGSFAAESLTNADAKERRPFSDSRDPRTGFRCASR